MHELKCWADLTFQPGNGGLIHPIVKIFHSNGEQTDNDSIMKAVMLTWLTSYTDFFVVSNCSIDKQQWNND